MRFKDEDGREWEPVPPMTNFSSQETIIIRPIEEPKKWEVNLYKSGLDGWSRCIDVTLNVTEAQAALIKDAVESLMWRILSDSGTSDLPSAIDKARKALKGDI